MSKLINPTKRIISSSPSKENENIIEHRLLQSLHKRIEAGTSRSLTTPIYNFHPTEKNKFSNNNEPKADFSSNDYLGLAQCPNQLEFVSTTFENLISQHWKNAPILGATGSRLLSGNHNSYVEFLEKYLARRHNRCSALLFNSGYDANLSIFGYLFESNDVIIMDDLCHNSIYTGLKLSRVKQENSIPFRHNSLKDLEKKLLQTSPKKDGNIFIIIESVYSMDGDKAPLIEICNLAQTYNAYVICDEAHGLGLFGSNGMGLLTEYNLETNANLLCSIHTFGKAAGCHGAVIACSSNVLKQYLINYARPFIYSTALPLHSLISIYCAYETMSSSDHSRRQHVFALVDCFQKECALHPNLRMLPSDTPIQAIIIPGNETCIKVANFLNNAGFSVFPIRAPTVPAGLERIRIILHYHNTLHQVKDLVKCLEKALFLCTPIQSKL